MLITEISSEGLDVVKSVLTMKMSSIKRHLMYGWNGARNNPSVSNLFGEKQIGVRKEPF